jgi:hypothetical protein
MIRGIKMSHEMSQTLGPGWFCTYQPKRGGIWVDGGYLETIKMFYAGYTKVQARARFERYLTEVVPAHIMR